MPVTVTTMYNLNYKPFDTNRTHLDKIHSMHAGKKSHLDVQAFGSKLILSSRHSACKW